MTSAAQFNIRDSEGRFLCPACGFPNYTDEAAYDDRGGLAGITICPCCYWEPGFDDEPSASAGAKGSILESLRAYRAPWQGIPRWAGRIAEKPAGWDGKAQLDRLFKLAPNVC